MAGGIAAQSGTSMAPPHVAGVAALWAERLLAQTGRIVASRVAAKVVGYARFLADFDSSDIGSGLVMAPQEP